MAGELVILRGHPGSGKSTASRRLAAAWQDRTVMTVALDDLRTALAGSKSAWQGLCDQGDRGRLERIIVKTAHDLRSRLLDLDVTVISDATHLNRRFVMEEIEQAERHDAKITIIDVGGDLDLDALLDRNHSRPEEDRLPDGLLESMWTSHGGRGFFEGTTFTSSSGKTYVPVAMDEVLAGTDDTSGSSRGDHQGPSSTNDGGETTDGSNGERTDGSNSMGTDGMNLLDEMRDSDLIRVRAVKGEDGIYSCNFTREAFFGHEWNGLTTKARGLFLDSKGHVVMRGFEKFFNLGENAESMPDAVLGRMTYPARVESKENGFLGLIGAKDKKSAFCFYSKSGVTDYSDLIERGFNREIPSDEDRAAVWKIIRDHDVTLAVEVVDTESDRHIIHYGRSGLWFIHAIRNTVDFEIDHKADEELDRFFKNRPSVTVVEDEAGLVEEIHKAEASTREGCVIYGANGQMVKVKSNLYLKTKSLRTPLRKVLVGGKEVPNDGSSRSQAVRWVLDHADVEDLTYVRASDGKTEPDMTVVSDLLIAHPEELDKISLGFK